MSVPKVQFPNFKEAYRAAYRFQPENFDQQVFQKCVYRRALPLAAVIWVGERRMFLADLEVILARGATDSEVELRAVMGEFDNRCRLERSMRRPMSRMRVSGARLSRLSSGLLPLIKPPAPSRVVTGPRQSPQDIAAREGTENRDAGEDTGAVVRRLERFHTDIAGGRPSRMRLPGSAWIPGKQRPCSDNTGPVARSRGGSAPLLGSAGNSTGFGRRTHGSPDRLQRWAPRSRRHGAAVHTVVPVRSFPRRPSTSPDSRSPDHAASRSKAFVPQLPRSVLSSPWM